MPWGTSRVVSTTPATTSLTSQGRRYPASARTPGGTQAMSASPPGSAGHGALGPERRTQPLLDQERDEALHPGAGEGREHLHAQDVDHLRVDVVLRGQPDDEAVQERPSHGERG